MSVADGFGRFWLECRACGRSREAGSLRYRCADCGGELVVRYASSGGWQDPARRGVWRYQGRLPLHDPANIVTLGEGATPLVELAGAVPGIASVQVKCEHLNPTGSFKDRIASVALSIVRERRLAGCVGTSSGNGGAAAAASASRAGVPAALFALADTPAKMAALGEDRIRELIKTIGLFRTKAKNVALLAHKLVTEHGGEVPRTREALEALPGVGRKTANVVLNTAFGEHTIAVDTHIFRGGNRTGMATGKTPYDVEVKLEQVIPPEYLRHAHHWLILHGRYTCIARKPLCERCVIADLCRWPGKTTN